MKTTLSPEIVALFDDPESVRVLATLDEDGSPHAVVKQSLRVGEDGNLFHLELLESSRTNRNLIRSIWFDRKVAVVVTGRDGQSFQIKGKPVKVHIAGGLFRKRYREARERFGDVDPAAVWIIQPEEVTEETFAARSAEEAHRHPYFVHLDRLAKESPENSGTPGNKS